MSKVLTAIQAVLLIIFIAAASGAVYFYIQDKNEVAQYSDAVAKYTAQEQAVQPSDTGGDESLSPAEQEPKPYTIGADFTALREVNDDVAAWISIPDTIINFPVVQGTDNDRYLTYNWDGKRSRAGCAFFDAREELSSASNLIVYGHAVGSGSKMMFSDLLEYKNEEYYRAHPYLYLSFADDPIGRLQVLDGVEQPEGQYRFQIYAICQVDTGNEDLLSHFYWFDEKDADGLSEYVRDVKSRSMFSSELEGTPVRCVTLSTCSYPGANSDVKLVVCAALCEETLTSADAIQ